MVKIEVTKRSKLILFALLIVINIILRIPSIPHEKGGGDSFFIHALSNSVTSFGVANWWVNWLSVFGLYPYSYASSIPFSLSGIAQLTGLKGLEMEYTILLFSLVIGLLSIFSAYIFAGAIYNDFLFKYMTSFLFSLSQGVMVFSTWEMSTRGPFIIFLPLFIYILLTGTHKLKQLFLLITLGLFLAATHHYFYFLLPLTAIFIFLHLSYKIGYRLRGRDPYGRGILGSLIGNSHNWMGYSYILLIGIAFMFPFFTGFFITSGSRYQWILDVLVINARFIGPVLIFFFGGFIYLALKPGKKIEEWYVLGMFLLLIPVMYSQTYGVYILVLVFVFFISLAFKNLFTAFSKTRNKAVLLLIVFMLLSFVTFSSYYNHERTGESQTYWYMNYATYEASVWTNSYIPDERIGFGNGVESWRLFSTSDAHPIIVTTGAAVLSYNLINESEIRFDEVSPTSLTFYFEGPYIMQSGTSVWGTINWLLYQPNINGGSAKQIVERFNITYFVEDSHRYDAITTSIKSTKNNVYSNGRINIWTI